MDGDETGTAAEIARAAMAGDRQRLSRQRQHQPGLHEFHLLFQPPAVMLHLARIGPGMEAALAALFMLEVLHRVGDMGARPVDARIALSSSLPAGPANGLPARSSWSPGCSPTKAMSGCADRAAGAWLSNARASSGVASRDQSSAAMIACAAAGLRSLAPLMTNRKTSRFFFAAAGAVRAISGLSPLSHLRARAAHAASMALG